MVLHCDCYPPTNPLLFFNREAEHQPSKPNRLLKFYAKSFHNQPVILNCVLERGIISDIKNMFLSLHGFLHVLHSRMRATEKQLLNQRPTAFRVNPNLNTALITASLARTTTRSNDLKYQITKPSLPEIAYGNTKAALSLSLLKSCK